jgi:ABC-type multidrug transport system fused ATPase/permease subunit
MGRLRRSAIRQFFGVLWRVDGALTAVWWGLIVLRALLPAALALSVGVLVGAVQGGKPLGGPLVATGIVFVALQTLAPLHGAAGGNLGAKTGAWLHDRLMEACVRPPGLDHLERPELADDLTLARDFDLGITGPPLATSMPYIASGFAEVAAGFAQAVVLAGYRWWAPLLLGGAWASTHVLLRENSVWRARQSPKVVEEQRHAEYAYRLAVDAPAAKEIRLFGLAGWTIDRLASRRLHLLDLQWQALRLRERPMQWCLLLILSANGIVFWSLAHDVSAGRIGLGALVVFAQTAAGTSALAFGQFDWWLRTAAQPVPVVLGLARRMAELGSLPSGGHSAEGLPAHEIRFEGVRFAYESSAAPVLDGLDLTILAGSSLAIVGQNGAGKTTLAKLICRLYEPQEGAITVDGVDLRELDLDGWRGRLTPVFQDFVRYELSLGENVAPMGADGEAVTRALREAGASGLAELDTVLSRAYESGTDLSGGQWQRVALARALCALEMGAGVVILDEPTAQLDVRGEAEIFDRILAATRGRTTVLISHRFSTVRHADRICVLEGGRVVELGTHDELMALRGRYRTMFDLQASRFEEEVEVA